MPEAVGLHETADLSVSSLNDVFHLFTTDNIDFPPSKKEDKRFTTITLATHGQTTSHLLGGGETQGILGRVREKGLGDLRLRAKEENNFLGVPVESYSNFGSGGAFEAGEPRISFQLNDIASYGEVNWVIPASKVVKNGGAVEVTLNPTQANAVQDGLHGHNRELGYYSPLGLALNAEQQSQKVDTILDNADSLLDGDLRNPADIFKGILSEYGLLGDRLKTESYDAYALRRLGKSIDTLTKDDIARFITEERVVHQSRKTAATEVANHRRERNGVQLFDPTAICFVTDQDATRIREYISKIDTLTDEQRLFLTQQLITYEITEGDPDGLMGLAQRIKDLSQNPRAYAELILPNMRLMTHNPEMQVEEVEAVLLNEESLIDSSRFATLGSTTLYAIQPQSLPITRKIEKDQTSGSLGENSIATPETDTQEKTLRQILGLTLTSTLNLLLRKKVSEQEGASEKMINYYLSDAKAQLYFAISILMTFAPLTSALDMFLESKGMLAAYGHVSDPIAIPMAIGSAAAMLAIDYAGTPRGQSADKIKSFLKAASESKTELPKDIKASLGPISRLFFWFDNFKAKHGRIPTGDPDQEIQPLVTDIIEELSEARLDRKNNQ